MSFLPDDNKYRTDLLNKICFLYFSTKNYKDVKLDSFLKILLSYHKISKKIISKM